MQQTLLDLIEPGCQRWHQGRATYRHPAEVINTERYSIDLLSESRARDYVVTNHYSGSYPAARLRVGLYHQARFERPRLCGVAVFSVPLAQQAITKYAGLPGAEGVELGRFVLNDEVPANAETWFLARAFRLLRDALPQVRVVLSYSDPVPRRSICGQIVLAGHVGTIYQAHNGYYLGRGTRRTLILDTRGRILSERALSKLRQDDTGAAYAYRQLRERGAPPRQALESGRDYVARVLATGPFRRLRHPGNHVYLWALGSTREQRVLSRAFPVCLPYPKRVDKAA